MLCHKLAGLKPAEKLVGIAAHISCVDFVYYDLALRVHNEASALCKAVFLDIHLKVAAQRMCGVGQHGISDLADALRVVMPRLMHEMCVGGYGINLAAGRLKLSVFVLQILKLGGADKGKVCGVEEEQAPAAEHVCLGDGVEVVVLVRLDGEVRDLLADEGHGRLLCR